MRHIGLVQCVDKASGCYNAFSVYQATTAAKDYITVAVLLDVVELDKPLVPLYLNAERHLLQTLNDIDLSKVGALKRATWNKSIPLHLR